MGLLSARICVVVDGRPRRVLSIWENKKGDVYFRMHSGIQVGLPPNNISILQHRYSIHTTPNSKNYSIIKKTLELVDGTKKTTCNLTNAIKQRSGFCPIVNIRFSDLKAACYDLEEDDKVPNIFFGEYDSSKHTMVLSVLVGSRRKLFPHRSPEYLILQMKTELCKVIITSGLTLTPSTPFSWIIDRVTLPPETAERAIDEDLRWAAMEGFSIDDCNKYHHNCLKILIARQIEDLLPDATQEQAKFLQGLLDQIPLPPFRKIS